MSDLMPLAREIATELGDGWRAFYKDDWGPGRTVAWLAGPDEAELFLSAEDFAVRSKGQVRIRGHVNTGLLDYGTKEPVINVSATKPVKRIAGDITRRLLPDYTRLKAEERERLNERNKNEALQKALVSDLAEKLSGRILAHSDSEVRFGDYTSKVSGEARVSYGGSSVDFKVEVPAEYAGQVAMFISALMRRTNG
jgi:hypothetical protein